MSIKRLAALLVAVLICVMMIGCSVETAVNETPTAVPTPSPTPKTDIEAVLGKPITLAIVSNADEASSSLFFTAAAKEAESMGVTVTTTAAGNGFDAAVAEAAQNADAVIVFLPQPTKNISSLNELAIPAAVFETQKGSVLQGMSHLYYESDGELDAALNAALTYPPHDTPVRLILLFETAESPAYLAYRKLYEEGKIFPKEVFIASEEELSADAWLTEKLTGYVEGMVDAVFAENATLAVGICDVLSAQGRTDMEVFCPGVTADTIARMQSEPFVFAQAVGRNDALAGILSVRAVLQMLHGEQAVTQTFEPVLINAGDLGEDPVSALSAIDSEKALLFNADWMDKLRDYYSKEANTKK